MRTRTIKPGFFKNEILGELEPIISLTFIGLWQIADREGRLEDRPMRIKGELFPYRDISSAEFDGYLNILFKAGFIVRYSKNDVRYIQIQNFKKHQVIHHTEKSSEFPEPNQSDIGEIIEISNTTVNSRLNNGDITVKSREHNGEYPPVLTVLTVPTVITESICSEPLIHGSSPVNSPLNGETPSPISDPKKSVKKVREKKQKTELPDDFELTPEMILWGSENGFNELPRRMVAFKEKSVAKGYKYANWKMAFYTSVREDWAGLNKAVIPYQQKTKLWQSDMDDEWAKLRLQEGNA